MKAVVYQGPFSVSVENVPDPEILHPNDVIVKITSSCICGSDLHMYEGRTAAEPGIIFGHENMGVVEEVGPAVKTLSAGDRVVMPFNVACGFCKNCQRGFTGFCTIVNPGFAGGAYGYVAMGHGAAARLNTCRCLTPTSTACLSQLATSSSPTSRCSPTSFPQAITARN